MFGTARLPGGSNGARNGNSRRSFLRFDGRSSKAFAASDGRLLWDLDTLRDFETVNKVKAHGGSINATGAVVAGGMLFANSGYGSLGLPGNVLLAFSVDGK